VAVGGPSPRCSAAVDDFEQEHPGIRVRPIYAGTYQETLAKALTGHKSGRPPDLAVLFAADMYTLIDADAIVPFEDVSAAAGLRPEVDGGLLSGAHGEQPRRRQDLGHSVPALDDPALLEQGALPRIGARPDKAARHLAGDAGLRAAPDAAREAATGLTTRWGVQIRLGLSVLAVPGLATANDVTLMKRDGTQTQFAQRGAVEALQYWLDLARVHKVHPAGRGGVGLDAARLSRREGLDDLDDERQPRRAQVGRGLRLRRRAAAGEAAPRLADRRRQPLPLRAGARRRSARRRSSSRAGW
jgi:sn-glycerol 3-phosphate transport system substrate-binding protein